jgi:quercetin dioxygenase-like cupin family protein
MTITVHQFESIQLSLFQLNKGDKIDRHKHDFVHTTSVAAGRTEVEIWGVAHQVFEMRVGDRDHPFPPGQEHEIRALEDGTIVVNLRLFEKVPDGQPGVVRFESC